MMKTATKPFIGLLVLALMPMGQLAIDIYMPSLPHMNQALQATNSMLQLTLTTYAIGLALSLFISGLLSDAVGRRPIILIGVCCYLIMSLSAALSTNITWFLLFRFIQGLGAGAIITPARAAVGETFSGERIKKISANMTIIWGLTPILAPLIGGYVQHYLGWRTNFYLLVIYSAVILLLMYFFQAETHLKKGMQNIRPKKIMQGFAFVLQKRKFQAYLLNMAVTYGYIIFYNVSAPFLLQNALGLGPIQYGRTILFAGVAFLVGSLLNKRLLRYFSATVLLRLGLWLAIVASMALFIISFLGILTVWSVMLPVSIIFMSVGFIYPNSMASSIAMFPDHAGAASALMGFLPMVVGGLATLVASFLHETSAMPIAIVSIIVSLLLILSDFWRVTANSPHPHLVK